MFRQINWSPTLAEIGFPDTWEPKLVLKALERRKERGDKIYTSAYLIPSHGDKIKIRYTVKSVLDPLYKKAFLALNTVDYPFPACTLETAHEWFMQFFGFGPFISYEVVSDLRHTRYLEKAPDIYTWANPGPGAKRGLNRLMNAELNGYISRPDQIQLMRDVQTWIINERDPEVLPTIEMRDIEHCLCEHDKFERAQERVKAGKNIGLEVFHPPLSRLVK